MIKQINLPEGVSSFDAVEKLQGQKGDVVITVATLFDQTKSIAVWKWSGPFNDHDNPWDRYGTAICNKEDYDIMGVVFKEPSLEEEE